MNGKHYYDETDVDDEDQNKEKQTGAWTQSVRGKKEGTSWRYANRCDPITNKSFMAYFVVLSSRPFCWWCRRRRRLRLRWCRRPLLRYIQLAMSSVSLA